MRVFDFNRALVRQPCAQLVNGLRMGNEAALAASGIFDEFRVIVVPEGEERAANVLRLNQIRSYASSRLPAKYPTGSRCLLR